MFSYLKKNFFKIKVYLKKRKEISSFEESFIIFKSNLNSEFMMNSEDRVEYLFDATITTEYDRHYIYHTAWAARILEKTRPSKHIDISSSLFFCSMVSAFLPVEFFDFRPPNLKLSGLSVGSADLKKLLFEDNSIQSLSCMHVVEHIGLARYGDELDYDGDLKAIRELKRVVASKGQLLFVVPIGKSIIQFNAHRIYKYAQVLNMFSDFQLKEFALIPDDENLGGLLTDATEAMADQQNYGCGCFWFIKK